MLAKSRRATKTPPWATGLGGAGNVPWRYDWRLLYVVKARARLSHSLAEDVFNLVKEGGAALGWLVFYL